MLEPEASPTERSPYDSPAGGEVESDDLALEGRCRGVIPSGIFQHRPEQFLKRHRNQITITSTQLARSARVRESADPWYPDERTFAFDVREGARVDRWRVLREKEPLVAEEVVEPGDIFGKHVWYHAPSNGDPRRAWRASPPPITPLGTYVHHASQHSKQQQHIPSRDFQDG